MMNPEIKALWVAALRSGEYKQCRDRLRTEENTFCCLGVLCNLHAQAHPEIAARQLDSTMYMGQRGTPSTAVRAWAGLVDQTGGYVTIAGLHSVLTAHNDAGRTFKQIAGAIEAQL